MAVLPIGWRFAAIKIAPGSTPRSAIWHRSNRGFNAPAPVGSITLFTTSAPTK